MHVGIPRRGFPAGNIGCNSLRGLQAYTAVPEKERILAQSARMHNTPRSRGSAGTAEPLMLLGTGNARMRIPGNMHKHPTPKRTLKYTRMGVFTAGVHIPPRGNKPTIPYMLCM